MDIHTLVYTHTITYVHTHTETYTHKLTYIVHLNLADLSKFATLTADIFSQLIDQGRVILHTQ